ncbi:MAG: hypothetical protein IJW78_01790 [Clostridia bacterium]|nr:hypothetical protein [Clostridia bacterium]
MSQEKISSLYDFQEPKINAEKTNKSKTIPIQKILLFAVFALAFSSAFIPAGIVSVVLLFLLVLLVPFDEFYLAYPPLLFFYNYLVLPVAGLSLFRAFTLILLTKILLKGNFYFKLRFMPIILVFVLYNVLAVSFVNLRMAFFSCVDFFTLILLITEYIEQDEKNLKKIFTSFAFSAIISYPYGLLVGNIFKLATMDGRNQVTLDRAMATFNDPNYMGFFFSVAVFMIICLKLFSPKIRTLIVIYLEICLLASLSMTALLGQIVFWLLYLFIVHGIKLKYVILIAVVAVVCVFLYQYSLKNDMGFISDLSFRVAEKIDSTLNGDIDGVTTNRAALLKKHYGFYNDQDSIVRKLFGGNVINAKIRQKGLAISNSVSHNEYIALLVNVGIIGALIWVGYVVIRFVRFGILYRKDREGNNLSFFMMKAIWLYYAFTLTLFMDERFFLFFAL